VTPSPRARGEASDIGRPVATEVAFAVTATDTGMGKTVVAAALAAALVRRGLHVGVLKPVETGVPVGTEPPDAALLHAAAGAHGDLAVVAPLRFVEPLAPLVAAERAGRRIELGELDAALARASIGTDAMIVEGAGGLLVPIAEHVTYATLFHRWHLGLIVVAANRLGVLNHVLLTVQAAESAGLRVRAIVLNRITAEPPDLAATTNAAVLRRLLPGHRVLAFPYLPDPRHIPSLADAAESCGLVAEFPLPVF